MYCFKCGKENKGSSDFCGECGAKLVKEESEIEKPKKKSSGATKEVIRDVASVSGSVAKDGVKVAAKGASQAKKWAIFASIIALLLAGANYYFAYMVESPDEVVEKALIARDKSDVKTLVSCLDPTFQEQFNVAFDLTGGVLNGLMGTSIDWGTLFDASSAFSDYLETPTEKCNATNFKVTSIKGEKLQAFTETFGTKIKSIGNALGTEAVVEFDVDNKEECHMSNDTNAGAGAKLRYSIIVRKYGKEWLIPSTELEKSKYISTHD